MANSKTKRAIMLVVICTLIMFIAFGMSACEQGYSYNNIKNNLKTANYEVSEGEKIQFTDDTDTTTLSGLQKIFFVTKGSGDDREYAVILIFDSISNMEKLSDEHMIEIAQGASQNCGENKSSAVKMGRYNNVVFCGYEGIKTVAKI